MSGQSFKRIPAILGLLVLGAEAQVLVDSTSNQSFVQPHVFFTGGGFIPPDFVVGEDFLAAPKDPISGAVLVRLITVQHAYSSSFDMDLEPKFPPGARRWFSVDGFENVDQDGFDPNLTFWDYRRNREIGEKYGMWLEDFNYFVMPGEWALASADGNPANSYLEPWRESEPGSSTTRPIYDATDELKTNLPAEVKNLKRYKILSNIGAQWLTGWPHPNNVAPVGGSLKEYVPEAAVAATNSAGFQLITGPLAAFWKPDVCNDPPRFTNVRISAERLRFDVQGCPGTIYLIQRRPGLENDGSQWVDVREIPTGGSTDFATGGDRLFFRLRSK